MGHTPNLMAGRFHWVTEQEHESRTTSGDELWDSWLELSDASFESVEDAIAAYLEEEPFDARPLAIVQVAAVFKGD